MGRYQPHAAAEVLSDGYGDCKDKHTLLAALLSAEGIQSYPALINSSTDIDPDIPAPSQFDHVITVVPQGQDFVWLDTTPEVAPFGMLTGNLRGKRALVIGSGPVQLVKTAVDPPFKQSMAFHIEGKIDSGGTLEGKVDASLRGDVEVALRTAFHRASSSRWNDVVQYVSQAWNFGGTVSDVTPSSAEAAENPFHLKYTYTRKDYPNWPDVFSPPLPPVNLAKLGDEVDKIPDPIKLESPGEYRLDANIEMPHDLTAKSRAAVNIVTNFAEYHATYSVVSNVVHAERRLTILLAEIPRARSGEYKDFWKAVSDDEESLIVLSSTTAATSSSREKPKEESADARVEQLIDLGNSLFTQDLDAAIVEYRHALQLRPDNSRAHLSLGDALSNKGDSDGAAAEYRETLRLRPDYSEAHRDLGDILYGKNDYDGAIKEYRETIRLKADDAQALQGLGNALFSKRDADGAVAAYRGALRITPDDAEAHADLGAALESKHDLDGALAEYREALRLKPDIPKVRSTMGNLLVNRGQLDWAVVELQKAIATDPMARINYQLLASAYTKLRREEEALATLRFLKTLSPDDAVASGDIAAILVQRKKYADAIAELQPTVASNPKDARLEFLLGEASIRSGDVDDGMVAFRKGVEINSSPDYLNGVSYELAEDNVYLDDALRCAEQAVKQRQEDSTAIYLQTLKATDLRIMPSLAALWDTQGWVEFRLGYLDEAEKYLTAAWKLGQFPDIADHLGQLYDKQGNKQKAIHYFAMALAAGHSPEQTRDRLTALLGTTEQVDSTINSVLNELMQVRTAKLGRVTHDEAKAEVFIEFTPSADSTGIKFISGSEQLRNAGNAIATAHFEYAFPNDLPVKLVRRGILDCPATSTSCEFVLLPVESVNSVD